MFLGYLQSICDHWNRQLGLIHIWPELRGAGLHIEDFATGRVARLPVDYIEDKGIAPALAVALRELLAARAPSGAKAEKSVPSEARIVQPGYRDPDSGFDWESVKRLRAGGSY